MCLVFMENHQIRTHIFFFRNGIPVAEFPESRISFAGGKQSDAQRIEAFIIVMMQLGDIYILG